MGKLMLNGVNYTGGNGGGSSSNCVTLTQAEYDLLTPEEKNNGTYYYISDSNYYSGSSLYVNIPVTIPASSTIDDVNVDNENILTTSRIDLFSDPYGFNPINAVVPYNGRCVLTLPAHNSAVTIILTVWRV